MVADTGAERAVSERRRPGVTNAALQHAAALQQAFPLAGRGLLQKDRTFDVS